MPIPDYQTAMLPLLKYAADGNEHKFSDAVEALSIEFKLTDEERKQMLPSGSQDVMTNRVGWARTYLKMAKLLEDTRRSYFKITERGKAELTKNPFLLSSVLRASCS